MNASNILPSLTHYFAEISQDPLLSRDEEIALGRKAQRGDEDARRILIERNLRLVAKIARDFAHRGVDLDDLIAEGNTGLMEAINRFDPERGAKLSTYAAWWIKQAMRKAIRNQSRTVRVPAHIQNRNYKISMASRTLREQLGREPREEEIAEAVELSLDQVRQVLKASQPMTSLDMPLGDNEDGGLFGDLVPDEDASLPDDIAVGHDDHDYVYRLLDTLPDRERKIIESRFGLHGKDSQTLGEVGDRIGITRERVRQLQNQSILRLRNVVDEDECYSHVKTNEEQLGITS